MVVKTYLAKEVKIEAIQYTGSNLADIRIFLQEIFSNEDTDIVKSYPQIMVGNKIQLLTSKGPITFNKGDYLVKEPNGEISVLSEELFNEKYK